jgi:hypothetical protein
MAFGDCARYRGPPSLPRAVALRRHMPVHGRPPRSRAGRPRGGGHRVCRRGATLSARRAMGGYAIQGSRAPCGRRPNSSARRNTTTPGSTTTRAFVVTDDRRTSTEPPSAAHWVPASTGAHRRARPRSVCGRRASALSARTPFCPWSSRVGAAGRSPLPQRAWPNSTPRAKERIKAGRYAESVTQTAD